jgi:thiamine-phosphate pyrophosphorylase
MSSLRLSHARLYACIDARTERGDLSEFLDAILAGGVDIVQLRDKELPVAQEMAALEVVRNRCESHGALWAVNDRVDVAVAVGAPILHLGQADFPVAQARALLGPEVLIGRSTHSVEQAAIAAGDDDIAYFAVGPVWPTPTKPGRPAIGLAPLRAVAESSWAQTKPWFAIGGVDSQTVEDVIQTGARRVVVVRALTQALDARQAAEILRGALERAEQ